MIVRPDTDTVRRFAVEHQAVRGQFVRLGDAWLGLREHGDYPEPVRRLLGEATCAAVLLASTLKFEGLLTLQMQGNGAVRLLVAQCTDDFRVRAVARFDAARVQDDFRALAGEGQVTVTIEAPRLASRYQGIVAIDGDSLSVSLEHYFATSEQLPTTVRLATDDLGASGLLVQRIPVMGGLGAAADDPEAEQARVLEAQQTWEAAREAVAGIEPDELLLRPAQELMQRALAGHDLRLFDARDVRFQCRCSLERVSGMLRSLGEVETRDILAEQGLVTVTCEFCHRPYRFDAVDVERLFGPAAAQPTVPDSLN
jgi:molecular chaperone Hsp33